MPDRRDDLDSWLNGRINPLPPPPGTFELIKRRARRRKYRRLGVTAGVAAVIVAAAVTVPQMVILPSLNTTSAAGAAKTGPASPTATATGRRAPPRQGPAHRLDRRPPVPPNFQPTSVTFVSLHTGWVIGQAGTPGHCATQYCTSVARTDNAGKTWQGVPAPLAGPADGATGVGRIRFLNLDDGWAFGPELFATHDGGQTWTQVSTDGLRVTDLETVGDRAFAVFASCTGSGPAFAAQCTSVHAVLLPGRRRRLDAGRRVDLRAERRYRRRPGSAASIVLTGSRGYLLGPDGMLFSGPVDGSAPGRRWRACRARSARPSRTASQRARCSARSTPTNLIIACTQPAGRPAGGEQKVIYSSADGGASWHHLATAPTAGIASAVAASPSQTVVLGTDQGIDLLGAGGSGWQQATLVTGAPAGRIPVRGDDHRHAGHRAAGERDRRGGLVHLRRRRSWQPSRVSRP